METAVCLLLLGQDHLECRCPRVYHTSQSVTRIVQLTAAQGAETWVNLSHTCWRKRETYAGVPLHVLVEHPGALQVIEHGGREAVVYKAQKAREKLLVIWVGGCTSVRRICKVGKHVKAPCCWLRVSVDRERTSTKGCKRMGGKNTLGSTSWPQASPYCTLNRNTPET